MSKDTAPAGLFSKVVKFVRNPNTSWTDLDSVDSDAKEQTYSKQALKEMIERKRRNDFVRKREFDMLRKLRAKTGPIEPGLRGRPSFFQSSYSSKPDDRAGTLKKIDEIEAQMSMQWWKTKQRDSRGGPLRSQAPDDQIDTLRAYRTTVPDLNTTRPPDEHLDGPNGLQGGLSGITPHQKPPASGFRDTVPLDALDKMAAQTATTPAQQALSKDGGKDSSSFPLSGFSVSNYYAVDVSEAVMDPEIEEAAIRFASGDVVSAEQGLTDLLMRKELSATVDEWMALLDLYRATGNLKAFENRAIDFAARFSRSAPQWQSLPEEVAAHSTPAQLAEPNKRIGWKADALVDAQSVTLMARALENKPSPWVLDWSAVESFQPMAVTRLAKILGQWAEDESVNLRFIGTRKLLDVLQSITPSGDRSVDKTYWDLHLNALRVMQLPDDFELAALDFCVTYEISPPGWAPPLCQFKDAGNEDLGLARTGPMPLTGGDFSDSTRPAPLGNSDNRVASKEGQLLGELLGDPQAQLAVLDQELADMPIRQISCRYLVRVDFSAAGAILNWASAHQTQGCRVRFVDAHRLIAAFFHVIGITEYADVVGRDD